MKRFLILMLLVLPTSLQASSVGTRIFYYRDSDKARESLYSFYNNIDVLAPQSYSVNGNGVLEGKIDDKVLAFARLHNIKVMPLLVNKGFAKKSLAILDDVSMQDDVIKKIIDEARANNFYGWQIDFEQMDENYKNKFTSFVGKFGKALRKEGLVSSVAVVSKISDNPKDYKKTLWQDLIGVYDYSSLGANVDFVSIMSYDDPDSKGPIARHSWLTKVLDYTLKQIPSSKVSLGVGLYYWKWDDARGKLVGIGGYEGLKKAFVRPGVTFGFNNEEKASFVRYTERQKTYTIYYENDQSLRPKLDFIASRKLHGFSAWALGLEVPEVFRVI